MCTVDPVSGALTIVGAGDCEVTVTAAVTPDYEVATAMTAVTVAQGAQTLSGFQYSSNTVTFGDTAPAVTMPSGAQGALSYSALPLAVCTVDPVSGALTIVGAGDCEVTVTAAVTPDYEVATAMTAVTVAQGAQTLSGFQYSSNTVTFGDTAPAVTMPSGAQGALSYSALPLAVCTVDPVSGALTIVGAGDCEVTVTAAVTPDYEVATAMTAVTVAQGAQTLSGFQYSSNTVTFGDTAPAVTMPSGAQGALSYSALPLAVCTVDPVSGALTIVGAGDCEVTVTAAVTPDYEVATAMTAVTVAQGAQTLSGFQYSSNTVTFGDTAPAVTMPSGAQGALSYSALPLAVCTVDPVSGALTIVGAGDCEVTVTAAVTPDYEVATAMTAVTVAQGAQTLSGFQYSSNTVTFGDTAPAVTMPSGAQGALSYSALPLAVCTVDPVSGALTIVGAGDCEVTVTAAVTPDYEVATAMTAVTVAQGAQTLSGFQYSSNTVTFGDTAPAVTMPSGAQGALSYSALPLAVCTVDPVSGALTIVGAGDCEVTVTAAVTADYEVATAMTAVTVAQGAQTLSGFQYSSNTVTFGDTAPAVTMPSGAQGALSYSALPLAVCTVDPVSGALTIVGAGDCEVTVTAAVTPDYEVATAMTAVTVAQGAQTLSGFQYSSNTVTFGDTAPAVTMPSGAQGALSYSALPLAVCTVDPVSGALTIVGAGDCEVTVTAAVTPDYEVATAMFAVTVAQGAQTLSGFQYSSNTVTFGDTAPAVTMPSGAQGALSYSALPLAVCTVDPVSGALTIVGAGDCEVTVTAAVTPDYEVATAMTAVTVAQGAQTLSGFQYSSNTVTFGDTAPAVTMPSGAQGALSYSALPLAVCTVDPVSGALTIVGAGDCEVTVTAAVTPDYEVATAMTAVTVAQGAQTLSGFQYSSNTVTFGDTAPAVTMPSGAQGALSYSALPLAVCTVDPVSGALTIVGAGDCEVTVTAAVTPDYEVATAMTAVTVAQGAQTLSGFQYSSNTVTFGDTAPAVTMPSGAQGALSYSALPLAVCTVDPVSGALTIVGAGDCEVTVTAAVTPDYEVATAMTAVTVAQGAQTLSGFQYSSNTVTFGDTAPAVTMPSGAQGALSYSALPLAVCTVDPVSGALTIVGAGDCEVTVTAAVTPDYEVATAMFAVTVAQGAQTLSGFQYSSNTVTFGDTAPAVTMPSGAQGALSYSALPLAVCTVDPVSGALTIVGAGDCEVTVTAAVTADYEVATAMTAVTVAQGAQTLSGFQYSSNTVTFGDTAPAVTMPSGAQGALSYSALPLAVCTVDPVSGALTIVGAGDCEVTVTAAVTPDYEVATAMFAVTVAQGAQTLSGFQYSSNTVTFGDTAPAVTMPSGAQGALSYSALPLAVCTVDPVSGALTIVGAGDCEVTVTAAVTADYEVATAMFAVTVAQGAQTLSGFQYSSNTVTFGDTAPAVTMPSGAQGALSYSALPPAVCTVDPVSGALTIVGVGECEVTVTAAVTPDYEVATAMFTVTVAQGAQTLSGFQYSSNTVTFGDTAPAVTMPSGAQGALSYSALPLAVCTVDPVSGALTIVGAGDCEVTVTAAVTPDYEVATAMFTVTVAQGAQTLSGFQYSSNTVTFGDTAPAVTMPSGAQGALSYSAMPRRCARSTPSAAR